MKGLFEFYILITFWINSLVNYLNITIHGIKIGRNFKINGVIFFRGRSGKITIGNNLNANSGIDNNPVGGDTILRVIARNGGEIRIGDNVGISNSTIYCESSITINNGVLIGGGSKIWDTDFHSINRNIRGSENDKGVSKPIIIKKNAFIGGGSHILKGVIIGENSIIAAGSVVTKSIPDNQIWGGNPANLIRKIE